MLLCIMAIFSVQAVYSGGQSDDGASTVSGTNPGPQGLGTGQSATSGAMSTMDRMFEAENAEFTLRDEYYLGRAVAANILATYRPYTGNPELTRYVNLICQALTINSSRPASFNGYHVMILDSSEFNAFATPGGHIFLTRNLVSAATSEDMLAAIIAHELAHITLRHGVALIDEMRVTDDMTATAERAAEFSGRDSNAVRQAMYFRNSVSTAVDAMMKNGYSQAQEFEADREAVALLAASGYNPAALLEMLRILQGVQASQQGGFNTTHPSPAQRIANVQGIISRYQVQNTGSSRISRFKN